MWPCCFSRVRRFSSASTSSILVKEVLLAALLGCSTLRAVTLTWTGTAGAPGDWGTSANWGGTAPVSGDTLDFAGTTTTTTTNNTALTFLKINFNAGAGAFTLGGNAVTLGTTSGTTTTITNSATNTETINIDLTFAAGGAQKWSAASGALDFGGTINNSGLLCSRSAGAIISTFQIPSAAPAV